jgi:TPR repeat protein
MYSDGQGTETDIAEAVKWYEKAGEQNQADALYALARLYVFGLGVKLDASRAVELFGRAAQAYPAGEARERAIEQKRALMAVIEEQQKAETGASE